MLYVLFCCACFDCVRGYVWVAFNSVGVHSSLCLLCAVLGLDFVVLVSVLVCC